MGGKKHIQRSYRKVHISITNVIQKKYMKNVKAVQKAGGLGSEGLSLRQADTIEYEIMPTESTLYEGGRDTPSKSPQSPEDFSSSRRQQACQEREGDEKVTTGVEVLPGARVLTGVRKPRPHHRVQGRC